MVEKNMVTLTERTIMKSRSGVYSDTAENRRKHRVGQKYGAEKQSDDGEKTEKKETDPAKELEAVNKVIAAINEGKMTLPAAEVIKLSEKKQRLEAAKKQAEKINAGVKANEEKKNAEEAKETSKKINEAQKKESEKKEKPADELASAREELQRHKDKKDSWIAKYGKNSYETRLEQIKDNVERLKNKTRSEKEKKADEKNSKKAAEMKERIKGKESEETSDGKSIQKRKVELLDKYHEDLEKMNKAHEQEQDRIMKELDDEVDNKKRKELWTSLKEKTNKHNEATNKLWKDYESNLDKLEKEEDAHYDKLSEKEKDEVNLKEETEVYTRVKFDDVPNSGKVNLKKYLTDKVRKGVDEKWSNIKNIPTENLRKMEKGLVNDLNKNFEAIKKSQRAELLYSIMKVKGELESRGKETSKEGSKESGKLSDLQSKVPGYMNMPEYKKYISAKSEVDNFGKVPSGGDKRQRYDELNEQLIEATKKYKEALKKKLTT
jgi:hypothetical protein